MANINHVCTLSEVSDSHLPPLPANPSRCQKFKRAFRKYTIVSLKNPRCRFFFRSNAAVTFEKQRHVKSGLLHIIHPTSIFRVYWELWMMVVFHAALVCYPLDIALEFEGGTSFFGLPLFQSFLDFACLIDVVMTFYTGYGVESTKDIVLDPTLIAKHYLFGYFFLDVISSAPCTLASYCISFISDTLTTLQCIRMLGLLKIFRLHTLVVYATRAADLWNISEKVNRIMRLACATFLVHHWTACVQYCTPVIMKSLFHQNISESWIIQTHIYYSESNFQKYMFSIYRATNYLLGTGTGGDYEVITPEDNIVGILSFIVGNTFYTYMAVVILQMMLSESSSETKYQEIMDQLQQYMRHKELPLQMQRRLVTYYDYRFKKKYFRENIIAVTFSEKLRKEINLHGCRRLVENVVIFNNLPQTLVTEIVSQLKGEVFLPNDIIVKAGSTGDCMYFLAYGTVTVVTPTGKEICHLQDGAYFGEIALIMKDRKRIANVIAIEICEVYRLDRRDFRRCFKYDPELYRQIEALAEQRLEQTILIEELHKKYLLEKQPWEHL